MSAASYEIKPKTDKQAENAPEVEEDAVKVSEKEKSQTEATEEKEDNEKEKVLEMNIDELYLKRLNNKYNHWIDTIYEGEVLVVDKDHEDFVSNPAVLERICARLDALKAKK